LVLNLHDATIIKDAIMQLSLGNIDTIETNYTGANLTEARNKYLNDNKAALKGTLYMLFDAIIILVFIIGYEIWN
jgi:hypothetical protein